MPYPKNNPLRRNLVDLYRYAFLFGGRPIHIYPAQHQALLHFFRASLEEVEPVGVTPAKGEAGCMEEVQVDLPERSYLFFAVFPYEVAPRGKKPVPPTRLKLPARKPSIRPRFKHRKP
jgi:hypothetical protein